MIVKLPVASLRRALLALALGACASLASAASTFHVELDTSSFASTGWIDLQFNPGGASSPLAQAALSGFTGFGDSSTAQLSGNAAGSLATGYTFVNDGAGGLNGLFHAVNFGGKVGFNVTFSGAADPGANAASVFTVALYNQAQDALLGTNDLSGSLVLLNWTPAGTVVPTMLSNTIDTSVTAVSAVPEAETWLMLGAGLALVGGVARRRKLAA
ncbi:NF038129 family PEP-CTERM protein [Oxalobacteraceae bacterium OTU3CINTB1]|nr:NF038129 family PEP-CTERM protein [Oxalobacteraceae bacterium OTU3CINTB1]